MPSHLFILREPVMIKQVTIWSTAQHIPVEC